MKGFVDYLILENLKWERSTMRSNMNISTIPYLVAPFEEWMHTQKPLTTEVVSTIIEDLIQIDQELIISEDIYVNIKLKLEQSKTISHQDFEQYRKDLNECDDIAPEILENWEKALKTYEEFILLYSKHRSCIRWDNHYIPYIHEFKIWMQAQKEMTANSINYYMSGMNTLLKYLNEQPEFDSIYFYNLPDHFGSNAHEAISFLTNIDNYLTTEIELFNEQSDISKKRLSDLRSVFRKYLFFIESMTEIICLTEEDHTNLSQQNTEAEDKLLKNLDTVICDKDTIVKNFTFRLSTQDRFYKQIPLFYPIGLIRVLFNNSKANKEWFNQWIENSIFNIHLLTQGDELKLKDIYYLKFNTKEKRVIAHTVEGVDKELYTRTHNGVKEPMGLYATSLEKIHIDHTMPFNVTIEENAASLTGLQLLTNLIMQCGKTLHQKCNSQNRSMLYAATLKALTAEEHSSLVEDLKKDLQLLLQHTDLQLIDSISNFKKPKK